MRKRNAFLVGMGAVAGIIAFQHLSRALTRARESAPPYTRPTLTSVGHLLEVVAGLWKHPESLAMMRSNPDISGRLTDAVLASLLQGAEDEAPALADRTLAWLSVRGEMIHGTRVGEASPVTAAEEKLASDFARDALARGARPDPDRVDDLIAAFGVRTAHDLVTFVRLVTGMVLAANSWDATVSRFLGKPLENTRARDEAKVISLLGLAILPLVPIAYVRVLINPAG